ncbi:MAG: hypothetical protein KC493_15570 [Bacteriovoracaceae bacterium]|nr:hypothetical protein [Bacteriovoracaceae bacterium]
MKKIILVSFLLTLASCTTYSPYQATSNSVGTKKGAACARYILGFHSKGKDHISSAAKAGKISKIATVDRKKSGLFPFYWKNCTYVTGN